MSERPNALKSKSGKAEKKAKITITRLTQSKSVPIQANN